MRRSFVVFALAGCSFTPNAAQIDGGIDGHVDSNVDASLTGTTTLDISLGNATELDNFPLLVPLTSAALDYAKVTDPTTGFTFVQNGTTLEYEVDHWDPSGTSALWVRVPAIISGAPTALTMTYGPGQYTSHPFQAWMNYTQVLHFDTASITDSVGTQFMPTPDNITIQAGEIGNAAELGPSSEITFADGDSLYSHWAAFTLQFWINPTVAVDQEAAVMDQGSPVSGAIYDSFGSDFSVDLAFANGDVAAPTMMPVNPGVWTQLAITWDGSIVTAYADGVQTYQSSALATATTLDASGGDSFLLGQEFDNALTGALDELELDQTSHTADWIAASHTAALGSAITFTRQ